MIIDPGEMRHQAILQRRDTAQDSVGGQVVTWSDVAPRMRCRIDTTGGRELMAAQAVHAEVTHAVICRYRPEFADPTAAAAMRLLYRGRILNIQAVQDDEERHQWVVLGCSEGMNDG